MKKNILVFLCLCSTFTYAQKPVLKAGSLISIENKKEIRAKNVNVGDLVAFDVSEDIKVGDSIVISKGAKAYAKVLVANIIRKTKCFRILERNAKISKTKRNFSRLYPTPQKFKKIDRLRRNEIHLKAVRTSS